MLPSDLLSHRIQGETLVPHQLPLNGHWLGVAQDLIDIFTTVKGETRSALAEQLQSLEGEETDYRIKRGLAHILTASFSCFEVCSPLDPIQLRQRAFALSAAAVSSPLQARQVMKQLALALTQELNREVSVQEVQRGLYADLKERQILVQFEAPSPEALLHRYNLSQVQGILYRATQVVIHAYRNTPGEYKRLFRYLKLFGLMAYVEGDADHGFTLTIDGPASLFKSSTRYGLALAKLLPALLLVSRWEFKATLVQRDRYSQKQVKRQFQLTSDCQLVSHYASEKDFDSLLEASFAERWAKTKTDWQLEREVDLIPIPGSVMIPDFRLVHPSGKSVLLEIVGYWRPTYLQKKFAQVQKAQRNDLILAISERLNLEKAGVDFRKTDVPLVWFKDKLLPKAVLNVLESQFP